MMNEVKLGLEVEFNLTDISGIVVNEADLILGDHDASSHIKSELAHSMVEIICAPATDIVTLRNNIDCSFSRLLSVAKKYGIKLLPAMPFVDSHHSKRISDRYEKKEVILGDKRRQYEYGICGTHIHIDILSDPVYHYNIMTALDPLYVLMSSTPFINRQHKYIDSRVKIYRDYVFKEYPLHGCLQDYVKNGLEIDKRVEKTYKNWISLCHSNGLSGDGFSRYNCSWGPVRITEKTFETRSADSNILSNVIAFSALYAGIMRQLNKRILKLPNMKRVRKLAEMGCIKGLKDNDVHDYIQKWMDIAKNGLASEEYPFLEPFQAMLKDRKTLSDRILEKLQCEGYYANHILSHEGAMRGHQYLSNLLEEDGDW